VYDKKYKKVHALTKLLLPWDAPTLTSTSFRYTNGTKDDVKYSSGDITLSSHNFPENSKPKATFF